GAGACYRIEGTLELDNRSGLDLEGNGATFKSLNPPADQRAMWRLVDSSSMSLHNMVIRGSYANGGTYTSSLEHAHAVDLRGTSVDLAGLTMSDVAGDCVYFGRGFTTALTRSSGTVQSSTCLRTGRNAVAVAAGDHIRVSGMTTGTIGFDVFDVEPNLGAGWGSNDVTFDGNTIGSYKLNAYSVVESSTISNQTFSNNTFKTGIGAKVAVGDPQNAGYRPSNVTITGNTASTAVPPSAVNVDNVDGLTVTGNTIPVSGGPMAGVTGSCSVSIWGNSYPGGSSETAVFPHACGLTPASGSPGSVVGVVGSGLGTTSSVKLAGQAVPFTVVSPGQVTFTVPAAASTGTVTVATALGTTSAPTSFTVTSGSPPPPPPPPPPSSSAPAISGFSPTSGPVGTTVVVTGSGFTGATAATVNGLTASFTVVSATQLSLTVPTGASSGPISVTTAAGSATSSTSFSVTSPRSGGKGRHKH
ncbi:MAG TPA: IPT/TIG domain-containing protein, partial [Mycobacteriales bacterium]|nr:IPT/TIG domain-containing protein [Mycobacteriales bacterium]